MAKKPKKLNQILATEKELKTNGYKRASEIYKLFQKPEHFNGFDVQLNGRFRRGTAGGGWSTGNTIQNTAISANGSPAMWWWVM